MSQTRKQGGSGGGRGNKRQEAGALAGPLLRWYDGAKREMPWRQSRDPYAIWLSETMLQQTQVATVIPYYHRFLERFPTVAALAAAPLSEVLALWAGLGYYRRAKHLHLAAQAIVQRHGGRVPGTVEDLLALPGIGRYTAGAVGSIAFGLAVPVVDGNVMRVLARVFDYAQDIAAPKNHAFFWEKAGEMVAAAPRYGGCAKSLPRYGDVNQAVMELGATVCTPTSPACGDCPLRELCVARREGRQGELPMKGAKKAVPVVRRKALVILRTRGGKQEVLMMERPAGGLWEHMWEFPVVAADEKSPARVMGMRLHSMQTRGEVRHQLTHRTMCYVVTVAKTRGGIPTVFPQCDNGPYKAAQWVAWPITAKPSVPVAKVVHKLAAVGLGSDWGSV